jgi:tetratricopeptide (TPR) repeat protein
MLRPFVLSLTLLTLAGTAACEGAAIKSLNFSVKENGTTVNVDKFFNDGFGGDNASAKAFRAAQANDVPKAISLMKEDIAKNPKSVWDHYNLGILYEATGEWDKAEVEMKDAQRFDSEVSKGKPESRFAKELVFIAAHKTK